MVAFVLPEFTTSYICFSLAQLRQPGFSATVWNKEITVEQQFVIGALQEVLEPAIPDYSFGGTDLFSLRLWQWQQPTQQYLSSVNESKLYLSFVRLAKNIFFGVLQNFSN